MASVARSRWVGEAMPAVRRVRIWVTVWWPSMEDSRAATSWLIGAPSGRSGVMRRALHWNWSSAKVRPRSRRTPSASLGTVLRIWARSKLAALWSLPDSISWMALVRVGGQAAFVQDSAFVAARGLSGDGADE